MFTGSAPIVTKEDEIIERGALSDDEWQRIQEEVYGSEIIMPETDTMLQEGTALIAQALQDIPDTDKLAYLEALERAPELVERESGPVAFLRCEKFNIWAAAQRLVKYWNVRKKVFGEERAFLPMTQTGAMLEDMEYLKKGLWLKVADDAFGRTVVYYDRIKAVSKVVPRDSVSRCIFYIMQAICERESTQRKGLIVITNFRGYDLYKHFDRIMAKKNFAIMSSVPTRVRATHIFVGSGSYVTDVVLPVLKQMAGKQKRLRGHLHSGSDSHILDQLEDFGLGEEHAYGILGRSLLNTERFLAWMDERSRLEDKREEQYRDQVNEVA